jgi:hypothetical protein
MFPFFIREKERHGENSFVGKPSYKSKRSGSCSFTVLQKVCRRHFPMLGSIILLSLSFLSLFVCFLVDPSYQILPLGPFLVEVRC